MNYVPGSSLEISYIRLLYLSSEINAMNVKTAFLRTTLNASYGSWEKLSSLFGSPVSLHHL
jgi:hypothetical protein